MRSPVFQQLRQAAVQVARQQRALFHVCQQPLHQVIHSRGKADHLPGSFNITAVARIEQRAAAQRHHPGSDQKFRQHPALPPPEAASPSRWNSSGMVARLRASISSSRS